VKETGIYLYCLVEGAAGVPELPGVDPDYTTYALPIGEMAAVVSRVPLSEFGPEALQANVEQVEWIGPRARAHAEVIQALFGSRTLLPFRFGTIFYGEERVREIFTHQHDRIRAGLAELAGKEEWGVKFYGHPERLALALMEQELTRKGGPGANPGHAYLLRKKLVNTLQGKAMEMLEEEAERRYEQLQAFACAACSRSPAGMDRLPSGEQPLLKAAYLVQQTHRDSFLAEAARLHHEAGEEGVHLQVTGPWPPYSFCDQVLTHLHVPD
jgi:hypothetical protein